MTVTQSGAESGGRAARFEPIIRRSSPQERVIAWGLIAVGALGVAIGAAIMTYAQYRGMLACFAAAALCLLMGYLTLRPRTVFDRTGIHSRTLLRSYDVAWPGSRDDFVIARDPRTARPIRGAGPSVQATVRSEAGTVALGGMSTRALTEARAHYLMEEELDRIWAWAVSWGLVHCEDPQDDGARGGESNGPSHP
ncbi:MULTISPECIES: hypothetical protein [Actinomyces]|uniref:Uncharacterized protein n=1 Tax=Actinomyces oris TaxID=544580 RepID=A0A1Q8VPN3_9ACTO|nr:MULTISPECIES: hypothetical protein [Actinomyces]OLO50063.1 hypothetical protein BKH28_04315 [Actinomyces oris]